jgi:hypothetical protein
MAGIGADTRPIALVSTRVARAQDSDLALLQDALRARGLQAVIVDWDDMGLDWSGFKLALLRSTWDYSARLPEFLDWLARTERATRVVNPPAMIRWSLDKHYLAELRGAGVPTVATSYAEPGQDPAAVLEQFLREHAATELVVKPAVGSGARDAQRHARTARAAILAHLSRLQAAGRSALLQPYLERVDQHGETALIYINGEFSHAIVKSAVLRHGQPPSEALFAPESIAAYAARADELDLGARILKRMPFDMPLYARIDLLRDAAGTPCLLELEIAEPSLYLSYASHAPARLAKAVAELP